MPNWVWNVIKVSGDSEKVAEFIEQHIVDGFFDFNTVIPEPQSEGECPPQYNFNCNSGRFSCNRDTLEHDGDEDWFNWYDWRNRHWGTKWNSGGKQYLDLDSIRNSEVIEMFNPVCIVFTTAWSEPVPVAVELLRMHHDDLKVEWEFYSEDNCELGSFFAPTGGNEIYYSSYSMTNGYKEKEFPLNERMVELL